ncbi:MAG: zf-HC2 domain-containing protein [Planctomycetes bacterium]|nr:zf-HC2 domain-containing protein [Planctomycetota bacterium]
MTDPDHDLPCEEIEAMLPLIADGAVSQQSDPTVFAHLARCMDCQDSLARHDLVTLALARGLPGDLPRPLPREIRYRIPLPWATAIAASLAVALGATWLFGIQAQRERDLLARIAAMPGQGPGAQRPDTEIISIPGSDPRHPRYVILQGDRTLLVDPATPAKRPARSAPLVHPVGLNRY